MITWRTGQFRLDRYSLLQKVLEVVIEHGKQRGTKDVAVSFLSNSKSTGLAQGILDRSVSWKKEPMIREYSVKKLSLTRWGITLVCMKFTFLEGRRPKERTPSSKTIYKISWRSDRELRKCGMVG